MNPIIKVIRNLVAFSVAAITAFLPMAAFASHNSGMYNWHVGDALLTGVDPSFGPVVSKARNGDTIEVVGTGTMTVQTGRDQVTGGGTFVHKDSDGNVIGQGTWTTERLLSFRSYGNGTPQGLPENFFGGRSRMRIHLDPNGGGEGFSATLTIDCAIGHKIPSSAKEGIELNVFGSTSNFREEVSGATLFIKTG